MANLKLKDNNWEASGVYDLAQQKNQRQINADVNTALGNKAGKAVIAPDYSASSTYAVGDYVMYNGSLYRCSTAILTAEAWTAAHWTESKIGTDVSNLKSAKAPVIIDTASGAVASFDDGADGMPVKKLVANIEPVQDLHGYDHPWSAGSTKNLLQPTPYRGAYAQVDAGTDLKLTDNVATYSFNSDLSIISVNVPVAWRGRLFATPPLEAGTYSTNDWYAIGNLRITIYITDGNLVTVKMIKNQQSPGLQAQNVLTVEQGQRIAVFVGASVPETISVTNFMVFAGTDDNAYIPFENICPISGWSGANVSRTGKNLLPELASKTERGVTFTVDDNGVLTMNGTSSGGGRVFLWQGELIVKEDCILSIVAAGANFNFSMGVSGYNNAVTVDSVTGIAIVPPGKYTSVSVYVGAAGTQYNIKMYPMLRLASDSDTTFAQYQGTTIHISWQSEAGTVYGGTLDMTSGVLTVTMAGFTADENTQWAEGLSSTNYRWRLVLPNLSTNYNSDINKKICSVLPYNTAVYGSGTDIGFIVNGQSVFARAGSEYDTADKAKAFFTGQQFVYPLANPIEITLTPTQIDTLLGTNNIWADCGPVDVDYPADTKLFIQKVNKPTDDDMTADTQIASGKYFLIGNTLYLSTTVIPAGDTIIPGTNCQKTNLAEALNALNT